MAQRSTQVASRLTTDCDDAEDDAGTADDELKPAVSGKELVVDGSSARQAHEGARTVKITKVMKGKRGKLKQLPCVVLIFILDGLTEYVAC